VRWLFTSENVTAIGRLDQSVR